MTDIVKGKCYWKLPAITLNQNCLFFFFKELKDNQKTSDLNKDSENTTIFGNIFVNDFNILIKDIKFRYSEEYAWKIDNCNQILDNLKSKYSKSIPNCIYFNENLFITYFTDNNQIKINNFKNEIKISSNPNLESQIDLFEFKNNKYILIPIIKNNKLKYCYAELNINKENIFDEKNVDFEEIIPYSNCSQLFYIKNSNIFIGTFYNNINKSIVILNLDDNLKIKDYKEVIKLEIEKILKISGINFIERDSFLININNELYNYYIKK